jgi:hypothetical protein
MDRDREFAAVSDKMLLMLERLKAVEWEKRRYETGTPEFIDRAREAEELSRSIFRWGEIQARLADDSPDARERHELSGAPLGTITPRRLDRILADWREAELRLEHAPAGSPEAREAAETVARLRDEYRLAQDRSRRTVSETDGSIA